MDYKIKILLFIFANVVFGLVVSTSVSAQQSIVFVDGNLTLNCTGNYSVADRSCAGNDGDAYNSVAAGINNLTANGTLNIREGTYEVEGMNIGVAGVTVQSYSGERAVLHKTIIRRPIFTINAENVTVKDLEFTGEKFLVLNGWVHHEGNIWKLPFLYSIQPSELRFDMEWSAKNGRNQTNYSDVDEPLEWWKSGPKDSEQAIYVYSADGDPDVVYTNPGINQIDDFDAIGIKYQSKNTVIDNNRFIGFSHGGVKGKGQAIIKNSYFDDIGTDWHDHHIYSTGQHSPGNEVIIENNFFGYAAGAAVHLFSNPSYHVVRNNVISGLGPNDEFSFYGILLGGTNHEIYNNTISGVRHGVAVFRAGSSNNRVVNNLFYDNWRDLTIDTRGGNSFPTNNTFEYNYMGSDTSCGGCGDKTSSGGEDYSVYLAAPNIVLKENPFVASNPTSWFDFRLKADSQAIDAGADLGASHANAFSPDSSFWPAVTSDQNTNGSGWEIGAFVFTSAGGATPTPVPTPTAPPRIPGDANEDRVVDGVDYVIWLNNYDTTTSNVHEDGDFNADGVVDGVDYVIWLNNYTQ